MQKRLINYSNLKQKDRGEYLKPCLPLTVSCLKKNQINFGLPSWSSGATTACHFTALCHTSTKKKLAHIMALKTS